MATKDPFKTDDELFVDQIVGHRESIPDFTVTALESIGEPIMERGDEDEVFDIEKLGMAVRPVEPAPVYVDPVRDFDIEKLGTDGRPVAPAPAYEYPVIDFDITDKIEMHSTEDIYGWIQKNASPEDLEALTGDVVGMTKTEYARVKGIDTRLRESYWTWRGMKGIGEEYFKHLGGDREIEKRERDRLKKESIQNQTPRKESEKLYKTIETPATLYAPPMSETRELTEQEYMEEDIKRVAHTKKAGTWKRLAVLNPDNRLQYKTYEWSQRGKLGVREMQDRGLLSPTRMIPFYSSSKGFLENTKIRQMGEFLRAFDASTRTAMIFAPDMKALLDPSVKGFTKDYFEQNPGDVHDLAAKVRKDLLRFSMEQLEYSIRNFSGGGKFIGGTYDLVAYMGEFAITGPVARGAEAWALTRIPEAGKYVARGLGALARTPFLASRVADEYSRLRLPDIRPYGDDVIITPSEHGMWGSLFRSYATVAFESFTEEMGEDLVKWIGKIPGIAEGGKLLRGTKFGGALGKFFKNSSAVKGVVRWVGKHPDLWTKFKRATAYQGPLGEKLEEEFSRVGLAALGLQPYRYLSWEDHAVEAGVVIVPAAVGKVAIGGMRNINAVVKAYQLKKDIVRMIKEGIEKARVSARVKYDDISGQEGDFYLVGEEDDGTPSYTQVEKPSSFEEYMALQGDGVGIAVIPQAAATEPPGSQDVRENKKERTPANLFPNHTFHSTDTPKDVDSILTEGLRKGSHVSQGGGQGTDGPVTIVYADAPVGDEKSYRPGEVVIARPLRKPVAILLDQDAWVTLRSVVDIKTDIEAELEKLPDHITPEKVGELSARSDWKGLREISPNLAKLFREQEDSWKITEGEGNVDISIGQEALAAAEKHGLPVYEMNYDEDLTDPGAEFSVGKMIQGLTVRGQITAILNAKRSRQVDAFHGTPHDIPQDEGFRDDKIGTGEGFQAYGQGHYFTSIEGIAEWYATQLSDQTNRRFKYKVKLWGDKKEVLLDWRQEVPSELLFKITTEVGAELIKEGPIGVDAYKQLRFDLAGLDSLKERERFSIEEEEEIPIVGSNKTSSQFTVLYMTTTGQNTWYGTFRTRAEAEADIELQMSRIQRGITGEKVYQTVSEALGSDTKASAFLSSIGVDGIRFEADQGNRKGYNYVVFDERDIKIEQKISFQQVPDWDSPDGPAGVRWYDFIGDSTEEWQAQYAMIWRRAMKRKGKGYRLGETLLLDPSGWVPEGLIDALSEREYMEVLFDTIRDSLLDIGWGMRKLGHSIGSAVFGSMDFDNGTLGVYAPFEGTEGQNLSKGTQGLVSANPFLQLTKAFYKFEGNMDTAARYAAGNTIETLVHEMAHSLVFDHGPKHEALVEATIKGLWTIDVRGAENLYMAIFNDIYNIYKELLDGKHKAQFTEDLNEVRRYWARGPVQSGYDRSPVRPKEGTPGFGIPGEADTASFGKVGATRTGIRARDTGKSGRTFPAGSVLRGVDLGLGSGEYGGYSALASASTPGGWRIIRKHLTDGKWINTGYVFEDSVSDEDAQAMLDKKGFGGREIQKTRYAAKTGGYKKRAVEKASVRKSNVPEGYYDILSGPEGELDFKLGSEFIANTSARIWDMVSKIPFVEQFFRGKSVRAMAGVGRVIEKDGKKGTTIGEDAYELVMKAAHARAGASEVFSFHQYGETIRETFLQMRDELTELGSEAMRRVRNAYGKAEGDPAQLLQAEAKENLTDREKEILSAIPDIAEFNYKRFKILGEMLGIPVHHLEAYYFGFFKSIDKAKAYTDRELKQGEQRFYHTKGIPTPANAEVVGLELVDENLIANLQRQFELIHELHAMVWLKNEILSDIRIAILEKGADQWHKDNWISIKGHNIFKDILVQPSVGKLIRAAFSKSWWYRGDTVTDRTIKARFKDTAHLTQGIFFSFGPFFHLKNIVVQIVADMSPTNLSVPPAKGMEISNPMDHATGVVKAVFQTGLKRSNMDPPTRARFIDYVKHGGIGTSPAEAKQAVSTLAKYLDKAIASMDRTSKEFAPDGTSLTGNFLSLYRESILRISEWAFGEYIPMVKFQKYMEWAERYRERYEEDPTSTDKFENIRDGQNLYGEMNEVLHGYSKSLSDTLRIMFWAPGYATGNFLTIAKALLQWTRKGLRAKMNVLNSFVLGSVTVAVINILQGIKPRVPDRIEEIGDLFKIRTGEFDDQGQEIIIDIRGFSRDYHRAIQSALNAVNGEFGKAGMGVVVSLQDRVSSMTHGLTRTFFDISYPLMTGNVIVDFKKDTIVNVWDTPAEKILGYVLYEAGHFNPIGASQIAQAKKRGLSAVYSLGLSMVGARVGRTDKDILLNKYARDAYKIKDTKYKAIGDALNDGWNPAEIERYNGHIRDIFGKDKALWKDVEKKTGISEKTLLIDIRRVMYQKVIDFEKDDLPTDKERRLRRQINAYPDTNTPFKAIEFKHNYEIVDKRLQKGLKRTTKLSKELRRNKLFLKLQDPGTTP